jgi:protein tyrosine/serine phosphatase
MPVIVLVLALVCAAAYFLYFDTYHFAVVQDGVLYRDGVRNTRELSNMLRKVQPKTVVCLVTDPEIADPARGDFQGEFQVLKERGIRLERIPIKPGGPPTPEQIDRFVGLVEDKANQPVLVHCAQGVVRTGMMVAAYQDRVLGYDRQKVTDSIEIFGKSEGRANRIKWFLDQYYAWKENPAAATQPVPAVAPAGAVE